MATIKFEAIFVLVAAYLVYLLQISIFAAWPIFGGLPNLIALLSVFFIVLDRPILGFIWLIIGGVLIDLNLPLVIGVTVIPSIVTYYLAYLLTKRLFRNHDLILIIAMGSWILIGSELFLTIISRDWWQLVKDWRASLLILVPLAILVNRKLKPYQMGLKLRL